VVYCLSLVEICILLVNIVWFLTVYQYDDVIHYNLIYHIDII